jgi:hypothetical protein
VLQSQAAADLAALDALYDVHQIAVDAGERAFSDSLDYSRMSAIQNEVRARAGTASSWGEILASINGADVYTARAWLAAMPTLVERARSTGPIGGANAATLASVEPALLARLAELEPEPLQEARGKLQEVQSKREAFMLRLSSLNRSYDGRSGRRNGGMAGGGYLDPIFKSNGTTVTRTPSGGYMYQRSGGGLFG